jgi:diguanylate cyclase (GGDEF)-like protein
MEVFYSISLLYDNNLIILYNEQNHFEEKLNLIMLIEQWVFIILSSLVLLFEVVGLITLRKERNNPKTRVFCATVTLVALWLLFNIMELLALDAAWTVTFMKLSFIPLMLFAPTWLYLAAVYTSSEKRWFVWFYLPAVILIALMLTNDSHYLFWRSYEFTQYGLVTSIKTTYNLFFYGFVFYSYLLFVFGIGYLLSNFINVTKLYRRQTVIALLLVGGSILYSIAYVAGLINLNKDFSPLIYNIIALVLVVAMIRYKIYDIFLVSRQGMFDNIREGIIIFDLGGRIIDFNTTGREALGLDSRTYGKTVFYSLPFWHQLDFSLPKDTKSIKSGNLLSKVVSMEVGDDINYFDIAIRYVESGFILTMQDVTQMQRLMIQIEEMANFDSLTQLRNRRSFFNAAEVFIASLQRNRQALTIMLIDIDNFKAINDRFGHMTGDQVLVDVAGLLNTNLRAVDVRARYGGDEFIVMLPQTTPEDALIVAAKLQENLSGYINEEVTRQIHVSLSIGISGRNVFSRRDTLEDVLEEADKAMYAVKNDGKGSTKRFAEL